MRTRLAALTLVLLGGAADAALAQPVSSPMLELAKIQAGAKSRRVSSYDTTGGNGDNLPNIAPGTRRTLFDVKGAGIITHVWVTIAPPPPALSRHDIVLRMYWDGETTPSVEAPIGDFFGQGWDECYPFVSLPLAAGPREGRAMVSYFAMPFAKGARIEIENDAEKPIDAFYYYVDYTELAALPADLGRFHAWYNHSLTEAAPYGENEWSVLGPQAKNTTGERNYLFADIAGKGHYVGVNYYVDNPSVMWYGEGDDMFFIDGERWPSSLHGTGTEDYFNTSWSPNVLFQHPYYGYARVNGGNGLARAHPRLPLPPGRPRLLRQVAALHDRARARRQPHARPLERRVLVPDGAAQALPAVPLAGLAQADARDQRGRHPPLARRVAQVEGVRPAAVGQREGPAEAGLKREIVAAI